MEEKDATAEVVEMGVVMTWEEDLPVRAHREGEKAVGVAVNF